MGQEWSHDSWSNGELPALSCAGTEPGSPALVGTDVIKDNGFDRAPAPLQQLTGGKKKINRGKELMTANILPRA